MQDVQFIKGTQAMLGMLFAAHGQPIEDPILQAMAGILDYCRLKPVVGIRYKAFLSKHASEGPMDAEGLGGLFRLALYQDHVMCEELTPSHFYYFGLIGVWLSQDASRQQLMANILTGLENGNAHAASQYIGIRH